MVQFEKAMTNDIDIVHGEQLMSVARIIAKSREEGYTHVVFSDIYIEPDVLQYFLKNGYRVFCRDCVLGDCSIVISWDKAYRINDLMEKELFLQQAVG